MALPPYHAFVQLWRTLVPALSAFRRHGIGNAFQHSFEVLQQLLTHPPNAGQGRKHQQLSPTLSHSLEILQSFQEDMAAQKPNMEALLEVACKRKGTGGNQGMIRKINDLRTQEVAAVMVDRHGVLTDARMRLKDTIVIIYLLQLVQTGADIRTY